MTFSEDETPDRIEIRALRVVATHGVLPEERVRSQPFEVDVDVWLDLALAADSDRLDDTVDYAALIEQVRSVVEARSFRLLEALAGAAADAVLDADERATAVQVVVRKLRPPVGADVGTVGVRVMRRRGAGASRVAS